LVELRHALAVVVGHFEVNDRVHFAHDGPPCRWFETFEENATRRASQRGHFLLSEGQSIEPTNRWLRLPMHAPGFSGSPIHRGDLDYPSHHECVVRSGVGY
jgi:hypothetical protein